MSKYTGRKTAVSKADKAMSDYILVRDNYDCYCGEVATQNGHYFSRKNYSTRWDEKNCLACCAKCNFEHNLNPEPMRRAMLKAGRDLVGLEIKFNSQRKFTTDELREVAEYYREKGVKT